jgi:hypothetical protein
MSFLKNLKEKVVQANPELAEKTTQALKRAKDMAIEAGQKSAPIIKDVTSKAAAYAQENAPVVKAQAKKALDDAVAYRAALKERARQDKAAHDEYVRTMYEVTLSPQDHNFLDEPFTFFDRQFYFFALSGSVLDTAKRNQSHLHASHSAHHGSHGVIIDGYGSYGSNSSSHLAISSHNTTEHEFWLLLQDGKEMAFGLANSKIPMRTGQHLTLFFCRESTSDTGNLCGLYNHASGQYHEIMTAGMLNSHYGIYVKQPGWFDKQEVTSTKNRLLAELDKRLSFLVPYAEAHHTPLAQGQAITVDD